MKEPEKDNRTSKEFAMDLATRTCIIIFLAMIVIGAIGLVQEASADTAVVDADVATELPYLAEVAEDTGDVTMPVSEAVAPVEEVVEKDNTTTFSGYIAEGACSLAVSVGGYWDLKFVENFRRSHDCEVIIIAD